MKIHFRLNIFFLIVSCLTYLSVYVSPSNFWWSGFLAFGIPVVFFVHFFYVYYWLKNGAIKYLIIPFLAMILGANQLNRTISFDFSKVDIYSPRKQFMNVLSANVRVFNVYEHLLKENPESSKQYMTWLKESDNDILCIQEFYNEKNNKVYNTTKQLSRSFPNYFVKPSAVNRIGAEFGLAIFSKHKIINKGIIEFKNTKHNQAIYADVQWNNKIIRVFNIHLESLHINENELFDINNNTDEIQKVGKSTIKQLKKGFEIRAIQINMLVEEIKNSPYPVIICGDINDLPYSYSYQSLKNILNNAFEEKGMGIGTTYRGKIPFLRIDNQFFSDEFEINSFKIHKEIKHSDHYPISAKYSLKEK